MSQSLSIAVAFTINDAYVKPLLVALVSLFENAHADTVYDVYVVNYKLHSDNRQRIEQLVKYQHPQGSIIFVDLSDNQFNQIPAAGGNYNKEVNYRLLLPELLPNIDKILYMDVDILILSDLSDLFNFDMSRQAVLFTRCMHELNYVMHCVAEIAKIFDHPLIRKYNMWGGNSGVLLMNLVLWRQLNWVEDSIKILNEAPSEVLFFPDQAVINYLMMRDDQYRFSLPWIFNADPTACVTGEAGEVLLDDSSYKFFMMNEFVNKEWKEAQKVCILHFYGRSPWQVHNGRVPFRDLYQKYAEKIGWKLPSPSSPWVKLAVVKRNIKNWVKISGKKVYGTVVLGFVLGLMVAGLLSLVV